MVVETLSAGELGAMMMITCCPSAVRRLELLGSLSPARLSSSSTTVGQPSVVVETLSAGELSSWFWSSWMSE